MQGAALSGADLTKAYLTGACLRNARLTGADLRDADLRATDLCDAEMEHLQSIAGADFTLAQGLTEATKAMLKSRPYSELDVWNAYTRTTTRESLSA